MLNWQILLNVMCFTICIVSFSLSTGRFSWLWGCLIKIETLVLQWTLWKGKKWFVHEWGQPIPKSRSSYFECLRLNESDVWSRDLSISTVTGVEQAMCNGKRYYEQFDFVRRRLTLKCCIGKNYLLELSSSRNWIPMDNAEHNIWGWCCNSMELFSTGEPNIWYIKNIKLSFGKTK